MAETEINGQTYKTNKLDTIVAGHVARKLLPVVAKLPMGQPTEDAGITGVFSPIAEALADMKDENADYITSACMAVCQRKEGQRWANIWNKQANTFMYDDIDVLTMYQLLQTVLQEQLGPFFGSRPGTGDQAQAPSPQSVPGSE